MLRILQRRHWSHKKCGDRHNGEKDIVPHWPGNYLCHLGVADLSRAVSRTAKAAMFDCCFCATRAMCKVLTNQTCHEHVLDEHVRAYLKIPLPPRRSARIRHYRTAIHHPPPTVSKTPGSQNRQQESGWGTNPNNLGDALWSLPTHCGLSLTLPTAFTHGFTYSIVPEHLLCVRHCSRSRGCGNKLKYTKCLLSESLHSSGCVGDRKSTK